MAATAAAAMAEVSETGPSTGRVALVVVPAEESRDAAWAEKEAMTAAAAAMAAASAPADVTVERLSELRLD